MRRLLLTSMAILLTCGFGLATPLDTPSDTPSNVTVSSKGDDVRGILSDLFTQAKKSFVLAPYVHFALYLNLRDVPFDEALLIVLHTANLRYELQNGIYFIRPASNSATTSAIVAPTKAKPAGPLTVHDLQKHVSVRAAKKPIKDLFAELSKATGIAIEVDASVPAYKLDCVLVDTSLKYALTRITEATKLCYTLTDHKSVLISKPADPNRVAVVASP